MSSHEPKGMQRREVLCTGGAAAFSAIVASILGSGKAARAAPLSMPVPEVDRVSVRVVVDSYQIAVAPGVKKDDVDVQRFGWGLSNAAPSRTLISEFGLSMHAESYRGAEVRNILVDFGYTPEAINNNMELLGVDPATLDALVLSHGHYDHFGGLVGFLKKNGDKLKAKIPFYVGGEECFCSREWVAPPTPGNFGVLDRRALQASNAAVTFSEGPSLVADHAFTTGQIGLSSFEKVLSPSKMKSGLDIDVGCYPEKCPEDERMLGVSPDQFRHEIATAYNLKGRGLVVLTSCSHRGVANAIKSAQAASGVEQVHAVIGGFHLAPHKEDYVHETVAALKGLNTKYGVPLHCTGEAFYEIAQREMPERLLRSYTGTRFVFT